MRECTGVAMDKAEWTADDIAAGGDVIMRRVRSDTALICILLRLPLHSCRKDMKIIVIAIVVSITITIITVLVIVLLLMMTIHKDLPSMLHEKEKILDLLSSFQMVGEVEIEVEVEIFY